MVKNINIKQKIYKFKMVVCMSDNETKENSSIPSECSASCCNETPKTTVNIEKDINDRTKVITANTKGFHIEHNKSNLRIIGNYNRIRIIRNDGTLEIVGNSTRLKIKNNNGQVHYTGNDGRICLGSDSLKQNVNYIGCNGILKIANLLEFDKLEKSTNKSSKESSSKQMNVENVNNVGFKANDMTQQKQKQILTPNYVYTTTKSASFSGQSKCTSSWEQFTNLFQTKQWQKFANLSEPNLRKNYFHKQTNVQENSFCKSKCDGDCKMNNKPKQQRLSHVPRNCNISNSSNIRVSNNFDNVVISNAVNVNI